MCSNNSNVNECRNGGQCSATDTCICASACFVGNFCEIIYNAQELPLTGAIIQDFPSTRDIYIVVFALFGLIGFVNNFLALTTFVRERIRISICGMYLIIFSILSIALMATILTYITTIVRYNNHTYHLVACYVIPYVSLIMTDGSILFTAAIAVERGLVECLNFGFSGSRIRGLVVSVIIVLFACGSNIDEIFLRRLSHDLLDNEICIYDFDGHPAWRRFDIVFSYTHVIIPCVTHLTCTVYALTTIARRKIFIRSTEHKFCRVWLQQLYNHRDFLIPPACLILCILPHGILGHLLQTCIPYSDKAKLRLHISFVLLLFVPQMLSFMLYVYPNEIYWQEFQQTTIYRTLCCLLYHKQRKLRQEKQMRLRKVQRKSSEHTIHQGSSVTAKDEGIL